MMKKAFYGLVGTLFSASLFVACGSGDISDVTADDETLQYLQDSAYYAQEMEKALESCKMDAKCATKLGSFNSASSESSSSIVVESSSSAEASSSSVAVESSSSAESSSSSAAVESSSSAEASSSSAAVESSSSAEASSSSAAVESSSSAEASSSSAAVESSSSAEASSSSVAVESSSSAEASSSSVAVESSSSAEASSSSVAVKSSSSAESSSSSVAVESSSSISYTDIVLTYSGDLTEISAGAYAVYSTNPWSGSLRCEASSTVTVLVDDKEVLITSTLNSVEGTAPRTDSAVYLIVPEGKSIRCNTNW